jgi:iron-sulfur cluster assembly protein
MAITLTERAASEVKRVLEEQKFEPDIMLRVGVVGGGCSGFQYSLGFDKAYDAKQDSKYEMHGVTVVVD